ncbi:hypothetical protein BD408DRAFT_421585 [Parasitella parasitica]|nr:hypothetical protein BD408DRAFT_421585 [Parasitella parasitica]
MACCCCCCCKLFRSSRFNFCALFLIIKAVFIILLNHFFFSTGLATSALLLR